MNFRYLIAPSKSLPGSIPLDFKKEDLITDMNVGYSDAQNVVYGGKTGVIEGNKWKPEIIYL